MPGKAAGGWNPSGLVLPNKPRDKAHGILTGMLAVSSWFHGIRAWQFRQQGDYGSADHTINGALELRWKMTLRFVGCPARRQLSSRSDSAEAQGCCQ
jgi:hypothetical protein